MSDISQYVGEMYTLRNGWIIIYIHLNFKYIIEAEHRGVFIKENQGDIEILIINFLK